MIYNVKLLRKIYILFNYIKWKLLGLKSSGLVKIQANVIMIAPKNITIGNDCTLYSGCILKAVTGTVKIGDNISSNTGKIAIGNNTSIGEFSILNSMDHITIGANVLIAPHCYIGDNNHNISDVNKTIKEQGLLLKPVIIEDNVWISEHVSIMSGVVIGKGSVVASSAVVTKNVEPYSIVAGVPAKIISYRKESRNE